MLQVNDICINIESYKNRKFLLPIKLPHGNLELDGTVKFSQLVMCDEGLH